MPLAAPQDAPRTVGPHEGLPPLPGAVHPGRDGPPAQVLLGDVPEESVRPAEAGRGGDRGGGPCDCCGAPSRESWERNSAVIRESWERNSGAGHAPGARRDSPGTAARAGAGRAAGASATAATEVGHDGVGDAVAPARDRGRAGRSATARRSGLNSFSGARRIAAAAAPRQPRTGLGVASRACIRDGGGTAARQDSDPADGRSAPRSPLPSPPALAYEHNGESRGRPSRRA